VSDGLVLGLSNEDFMFTTGKVLTLLCIKVHVCTIHLGGSSRGEITPALHLNLNLMVLKTNKGEGFGPIFTEEEGNHEIIGTLVGSGTGIITDLSGRDGAGSFGTRVFI